MSAPMSRVAGHKFCTFFSKCSPQKLSVFNPVLSRRVFQRTVSNFSRNHTNWRGKWIKIGALCAGSAVTALLAHRTFHHKFDFGLPLPHVHAIEAVDKDSPRYKFNFIADVVEKAAPAVVHIEIQGRHPFTGQIMPVSNGSGFIVREDGLILSNAHVVANKTNVVVQLKDGRRFDGVVQAVDSVSDLATIKIRANNLPTLKLGKSSEVRAGEFIIAMGSPLTLSDTVTSGIVSTPDRGLNVKGKRGDMTYIQTDAVITHGNSGGPLITLDGEAVGINTMKLTAGISFAIPSDYARSFLDRANQLEKRSQRQGFFGSSNPRRFYVGIKMLTLTPDIIPELVRRFDLYFPADITGGVLVHEVYAGSPAQSAGLRPGDIITSMNGQDIKSSNDVYNAISNSSGLSVTVRRGHDTLLLTITPEEVS